MSRCSPPPPHDVGFLPAARLALLTNLRLAVQSAVSLAGVGSHVEASDGDDVQQTATVTLLDDDATPLVRSIEDALFYGVKVGFQPTALTVPFMTEVALTTSDSWGCSRFRTWPVANWLFFLSAFPWRWSEAAWRQWRTQLLATVARVDDSRQSTAICAVHHNRGWVGPCTDSPWTGQLRPDFPHRREQPWHCCHVRLV